MQEKKLLRDAAKNAVRQYDSHEDDPVMGARYERGITPLKEALASTTEETEMEKLRVYLKAELKREQGLLDIGDVGVEIAALNQCAVYESVLAYITTQFGEEEGDADRGD